MNELSLQEMLRESGKGPLKLSRGDFVYSLYVHENVYVCQSYVKF